MIVVSLGTFAQRRDVEAISFLVFPSCKLPVSEIVRNMSVYIEEGDVCKGDKITLWEKSPEFVK